jgi:choline dehydrogenase-like flavoprotein
MFSPSLAGSPYRSALALAEAMIPGSPTVPAADESTVARAQEVVRDLHPSLVRAWGAAQQAFDAAALARTGRPFHALSAAKQEELLTRWQSDPVLKNPLALLSLLYRFVHFDRRDVYGALGGKLNVVEGLDSPHWLSQIHATGAWDQGDVECDVVVVGTGAGGAVVGKELADRGYAVVFVEEGDHHRRNAFDGSMVSAHKRFYRAAFSVGNAPMPIFVGRLVGGSTAINGGTCFRTPPWVLERWCDQIGTDELSESSMAPYFERVENFLEVATSGRKEIGPIADFIARGCDALGWHHFPVLRNAPGCNGLGFCDFGCRTDARRGTNISYVPAALQKGAMVFTGGRADRVLLEGGRAVGVEAVAGNGKSLRIRAKAVVLSGGALPTPMLLLQQGLANRSGEVGRNLTLHPSVGFAAVAEELIHPAGHIPQGYGFDHFLREGILVLAAQPDFNVIGAVLPYVGRRLMEAVANFEHLAHFGILISDASANGRVWRDVGGVPAITYNIASEDVRKMQRAIVLAAEMSLAAGAKRIYPMTLGTEPIEGTRALDDFRKAKLAPADFVWTSYHPLGTCKMGRDPKTSVIGIDHQAHDVRGLFVVDASAVSGPIGVNPQLTIMAMATRAAGKIADRLG